MLNTDGDTPPDPGSRDEAVNAIVRGGAGGAMMVTAIATAIVIGLWLAFYILIFLPRASAP